MRKTDINKYVGSRNKGKNGATTTAKSIGHIIIKSLLTLFTVILITGAVVSISLVSFVLSMKDESMDYDLHKLQLNYTSFIYVNGPNDDSTKPVEYQSLSTSENRVWVDYDKIPKAMKDAIIAIEDKRFEEHQGVDWIRTFGAVTTLFSKGSSYGGSTITQQLIKNVTGDKDVSITRKVKEIFRALNLEKKYSKEEILAAYLNIVNFGSGSNGVQAAANLYFNKDIVDCDIAECAAIAGITQNPSAYSPLVHPDANKKRQQTVLSEMLGQGKITDAEYNTAMAESEHMKFVGKTAENIVDNVPIWNWYVDTLFENVKNDLMIHYNCSSEKAIDMIYHDGLKIYASMDTGLQTIAEDTFKSNTVFGSDTKLQAGYMAMDYSGRVLATVGSRGVKLGNRLQSLADAPTQRQPGSTIKPLAVYGPAIDSGKYNFSSLVNDNPLPNWFSDGSAGPKNWGPGNTSGKYWGMIPLETALERSLNATAAQIGTAITPNLSYNFLKDKLGFTSLVPADNNRAPMSIGGLSVGVTVREMTAAYQMFANGGKYYKSYTYYHVDDHDGKVILDNRNPVATQAISSVTASIMHRLLNNVITGTNGTGKAAAISGWEVFGKTGTTNDNKDSWFIGGTPYAIAGIWTGYLNPAHINNTTNASATWKKIMAKYLENKKMKKFSYDPNVVSANYSMKTGLLVVPGSNVEMKTGWYDKNNMPALSSEAPESGLSSLISGLNASSQNGASSNTDSGASSGTSTETQSSSSDILSNPASSESSRADHGKPSDSASHAITPAA